MNIITPEGAPAIRRVIVALNAPLGNLERMQRSVDIALRLKAEMRGLFIEDINLLRLAALPLAHEIAFGAGGRRPLDTPGMERMLRSQAQAARKKLSAIASRHKIPWSFQVRRGHVTQEVLSSATGGDLLILDRVEESLVAGSATGSAMWNILRKSSCTVLLQHGGGHRAAAPMLYLDDPAVSGRALRLAAQYFHAKDQPLAIILPPLEEAEALRARQRIESQMRALDIPYQVYSLPDASSGSLMKLLLQLRGGFFISGTQALETHGERLLPYLERVKCDCLVVRSE